HIKREGVERVWRNGAFHAGCVSVCRVVAGIAVAGVVWFGVRRKAKVSMAVEHRFDGKVCGFKMRQRNSRLEETQPDEVRERVRSKEQRGTEQWQGSRWRYGLRSHHTCVDETRLRGWRVGG